MLHLSFYGWPETFSKKFDKSGFFLSSFFIKLLKDRQEILKVKSSVLYFFELKLRVLFDFSLSCVNKGSKITKIL